ncbi:aldo/keto reductase [Glacieibacterium megasporae]|uniref:aldo/keto reductase n=1 Tax=Glacieibacterium megasporae TaxID=2835787 RepID=UPI001C1DE1FE|nr:aldo/keto reductase [Polymorphobacter megasporae]UAJ09972.1 aldo/keto reductase [Polymorphobacter megasporae]
MTEIILSSEPRLLGKSGMLVSPLAWGMWRFSGDDVAAARVRVEAAFEAGITLFDTADIYGPDNAERFGAAEDLLGRVFTEAPALRDKMVLASKGGIRLGVPYDSSPAYIIEAVDASLKRLRTERIDLWQIHRPDLLAHPAETAATLEELVLQGKIVSVGVSNHTPSQTAVLKSYLNIPLASTQDEFSPLSLAPLFDGRIDRAMEYGMAVLAWSPLGKGRLASNDAADDRVTATRAALDTHADKYNVSRAAVAYAWIMAHPAKPIPIVGSQKPARIVEAADAYKVRFERAEWYAILVASLGERLP